MNYLILFPTRSLGINLSSAPCLRNTFPEIIVNANVNIIIKIHKSQYRKYTYLQFVED